MVTGGVVTDVVYVEYGVKDNSHGLVYSSVDAKLIPPELLGLTDKPPGGRAGATWWPSVGCGPVGEWWALWRTVPDENAKRGGMVCSKVILWPLVSITTEVDLFSALVEIGEEFVTKPLKSEITRFANALITADDRPVVSVGLEKWPSCIAGLWMMLWPEARRQFSARVAISPPQGGESITPPWIYCVPQGCEQQWQNSPLVSPLSNETTSNRAVLWLGGGNDKTFNEILNSVDQKPSHLNQLDKLSRAADRLDRLRENRTVKTAIEFLRTIILIAPSQTEAEKLKIEVLNILAKCLRSEKTSLPLTLSNLNEDNFPDKSLPLNELTDWAATNLTNLEPEDAIKCFARLDDARTESWWSEAINGGIDALLGFHESKWSKHAVAWLGDKTIGKIFARRLPTTHIIENALVNTVLDIELDDTSVHLIKKEAILRVWSKLHAVMAMKSNKLWQVIFSEQWGFNGDPFPGLNLLVNNAPPNDVAVEAIIRDNAGFTLLAAKVTKNNPETLLQGDVTESGFRNLWIAHIKEGGSKWPLGMDEEKVIDNLLELNLNGENEEELISLLSVEVSIRILSHPNQAVIWDSFSSNLRNHLSHTVVLEFVKKCKTQEPIVKPCDDIVRLVASYAQTNSVTTNILAALISWGFVEDERVAVRWIDKLVNQDWIHYGADIGRNVVHNSWKNAAFQIYDVYKAHSEARLAATSIKDLLPVWYKFLLGKRLGEEHQDLQTVIERLSEVASEIAYDRLDHIWELAGGKPKELKGAEVRPSDRWKDAVIQAKNGKIDGGIEVLLEVLIQEYPNNTDLKELRQYLD